MRIDKAKGSPRDNHQKGGVCYQVGKCKVDRSSSNTYKSGEAKETTMEKASLKERKEDAKDDRYSEMQHGTLDHGGDQEEDEDVGEYGCGGDEDDDDEPSQGALNSKWEESFQRLVAFKEQHGHCLVPNRYPEDPQLGSWVSTQRRQYKILATGSGMSTPMTPERAQRLEEIGFQWTTKDPRHVPWEKRYAELVAFAKKYGHSQVPIGWKENVQLSNWVSTQRQEYKLLQKGRTTRLTPERIELLDKINFIWEAQRGGPRRKRRATVCVPSKPTPVVSKEQHVGGMGLGVNRGRGAAVGAAAMAVQRAARDQVVGQQHIQAAAAASVATTAGLSSPQAQASAVHSGHLGFLNDYANGLSLSQVLASRQNDILNGNPFIGNGLSLSSHPSNSIAGLTASAHAATLAGVSQFDFLRQLPNLNALRQASDLNILRAAAAGAGNSSPASAAAAAAISQSWRLLPHGAYQYPNPAASLGIFPMAASHPVSNAGYQFGMLPTSAIQGGGGGAPAEALHEALRAAAGGSGERKRSAQDVGDDSHDREDCHRDGRRRSR